MIGDPGVEHPVVEKLQLRRYENPVNAPSQARKAVQVFRLRPVSPFTRQPDQEILRLAPGGLKTRLAQTGGRSLSRKNGTGNLRHVRKVSFLLNSLAIRSRCMFKPLILCFAKNLQASAANR